jgi:hypothetical protein
MDTPAIADFPAAKLNLGVFGIGASGLDAIKSQRPDHELLDAIC